MITTDQVMAELLWLQSMTEFRENQPPYHYDGRVLDWGRDMPDDCMESMRQTSEVVLLNGPDSQPYAYLSVDSYNQLRQKLVTDNPLEFT